MARALAYARHHGFVHCDLKPANVFLTQRGDVNEARPIFKIEIAEQDRAFLKAGLPARMKCAAFPFQRNGLIAGRLDFISPATRPSAQNKQPVHEGRISLEQDHFTVGGSRYPVRYGMTVTAEIVVRECRLIDLALDLFRQVGG